MAITVPGIFVQTMVAALGSAQLALDLDAETHRVALYANSITPDYDASVANAAYGAGVFASGEVTGTGWAAGGVLLTTTTCTGASGTLTFDAADISQASTTLSGIRAGLVYADSLAGNNAIVLSNFGADFATTVGTLQVIWHSLGIAYIDLTP